MRWLRATSSFQPWSIDQAASLLFRSSQVAAYAAITSKQLGSRISAVTYRSAQKLLFLLGTWLLATRFCPPGYVPPTQGFSFIVTSIVYGLVWQLTSANSLTSDQS
jgi:hypothetical protein